MKESRLYDADDTELYKTNLYSGSDDDITNTEKFTSGINLTINIGAAIDFKFDASGSTDDLTLSLYKSRDSTFDGTEIAVWSTTIASDGSADVYHFTIDSSYGAGHFRFGIVSTGSSNTFDIDVEMRQWRRTTGIT